METSIFVVACLFLATISGCVALDYTVGDSDGWGLGVDYKSWSAGKVLNVGDSLVFKYDVPGHTVAEVNLEDYTHCTVNNSVGVHKSGSTEIPLQTAGTHYFICTVTSHCDGGMKLAVAVSALGGSGTTTPPGTSTPTPPVGGSNPQMVYSDAPGTLLSYGALALPFLLLSINQ